VKREPSFTLRVSSDEPRCRVIVEPIGGEYDLHDDDEVLIHVYSRATRPEDADVEIVHGSGGIVIWLPDEYRAWNKAGNELTHL
jgi:hypothetical protein